MQFTFSDNKTINNGVLQNFTITGNRPRYTDIDISNPLDNVIEINGTDYIFTYVGGAIPGNKGGHSIILKLYDSQNVDLNEIEYGNPDLILKISKQKNAFRPEWRKKSEKRFLMEIDALMDCHNKNFQNIIRIYYHGICSIKNIHFNNFDRHRFYVMEFSEFDLKSYIEKNHSTLSIYEKLSLCISLCEGIKELYSLGYYHRDIKPDNIFMVADEWKIGDLGLIDERKSDNSLDDIAEFIGPRGWLSPEAMNKHLCEGKKFAFGHDCNIDHQSDIFQLGKVFWYIFQYNAPIGEVKESDFYIKNPSIFSILKTMLRNSKKARYKNIDEVLKLLKLIEGELLRKAA